jgi:hypothetical protein
LCPGHHGFVTEKVFGKRRDRPMTGSETPQ